MNRAGIYAIRNKVNGFLYVGSAVNLRIRFAQHKRDLRKAAHPNRYLQRAWEKYGEESFEFEILEFVDSFENLTGREQFWIDQEQSHQRDKGYNLSPTAKSILGYRFSDEQKAKVSAGLKGKPKTAAHRGKLWEHREKNAEFLTQMSENGKQAKGRKQSETHRVKRALAQTGAKNHQAKLTETQVQEIRKRLSLGEKGRSIAKDFGVVESLISNIKHNKRWRC